MTDIPQDRRAAFRMAIGRFLQERLDAKPNADPTRYEQETWIQNVVSMTSQVQLATHIVKATHPSTRGATNLRCLPQSLSPRTEVGTHSLGNSYVVDAAIADAKALPVQKFISIEVDGKTLLDWMLAGDSDLKAALSSDQQQAEAWIESFTGLIQPRGIRAASHTRAKQLYWLAGDDPCLDDHYHLLAPLYPSSLAHAVFQQINQDRFAEEAKSARQARWKGDDHPTGYAEYPELAVQKLGGTKPQNISQLNSERRGNNYLLGSLPPTWKSREVREIWKVESALPGFGRRWMVRELVETLRDFLESDPPPTKETRNRRDALTDTLIDELVAFSGELREGLAPGWSADDRCELVEDECLWLDPGRADESYGDGEFRAAWLQMNWPAVIGKRFGNWLNGQLHGQLPFGDIEQRHWRNELLVDESWTGALHKRRAQLEAPSYIPMRGAS